MGLRHDVTNHAPPYRSSKKVGAETYNERYRILETSVPQSFVIELCLKFWNYHRGNKRSFQATRVPSAAQSIIINSYLYGDNQRRLSMHTRSRSADIIPAPSPPLTLRQSSAMLSPATCASTEKNGSQHAYKTAPHFTKCSPVAPQTSINGSLENSTNSEKSQ
jgi:hypothetical protein